jgi:hypothetical protein
VTTQIQNLKYSNLELKDVIVIAEDYIHFVTDGILKVVEEDMDS